MLKWYVISFMLLHTCQSVLQAITSEMYAWNVAVDLQNVHISSDYCSLIYVCFCFGCPIWFLFCRETFKLDTLLSKVQNQNTPTDRLVPNM